MFFVKQFYNALEGSTFTPCHGKCDSEVVLISTSGCAVQDSDIIVCAVLFSAMSGVMFCLNS